MNKIYNARHVIEAMAMCFGSCRDIKRSDSGGMFEYAISDVFGVDVSSLFDDYKYLPVSIVVDYVVENCAETL